MSTAVARRVSERLSAAPADGSRKGRRATRWSARAIWRPFRNRLSWPGAKLPAAGRTVGGGAFRS
jgi:hypothetical protein